MTTENAGEIVAAIQERLNAALRRIDENASVKEIAYRLAGNMEALSIQISNLGERQEAAANKTDARLDDHNRRLVALELKPARRWDSAIEKIIMTAAAAAVAYILAKMGV